MFQMLGVFAEFERAIIVERIAAGLRRARAKGIRLGRPRIPAECVTQIKRDLAAEKFGCYVLDEFTYPMKWGWVDVADVVTTMAQRPGNQHVVITGRDAHPDLIAAADLVVDMTKIKHPMDAGQKGQKGIEW